MIINSDNDSNWIKVGVIVGTKGLLGELKISLLNFVNLTEGAPCKVGFSLSHSEDFILERFKQTFRRYSYVKLKNIDSIDEAKKLVEMAIFCQRKYIGEIDGELVPFEASVYIGFDVFDITTNTIVGKFVEIIPNPGNDLLAISTKSGIKYIPFIDEFVKEIDENKKVIKIKSIEGLLD